MCGIVGFVSKHTNGFSTPEKDMFTRMLFLDTLRGWDSTGVMGITKNGSVQIHKGAIPGSSFIWTKEYGSLADEMLRTGTMLVGHNRAATRGEISDANAHPFYVDDKIVLVQNGTWRGDFKHIKDVAVDSHAIAHLLAETDDIQEAINKINAAFALAWYNTATNSLNLIRNSERPLYVAKFDHRGLMFASEIETILYALSKEKNTKLVKEPYLLPEYQLLSVHIEDNTYEVEERQLTSPKTTTTVYTPWQEHFQHGAYQDVREARDVQQYGHKYHEYNNIQQHSQMGGRTHTFSGKPDDYTRTLHAWLRSPEGREYCFNSEAEAIEAHDKLVANRGEDKTFVTCLDYIPANDHERCSVFHFLSTPDLQSTGPVGLVYFTQFNIDEKRANQIGAGYAMMHYQYPQIMQFLDDSGEKRWFVTAAGYGYDEVKGAWI